MRVGDIKGGRYRALYAVRATNGAEKAQRVKCALCSGPRNASYYLSDVNVRGYASDFYACALCFLDFLTDVRVYRRD